MKRMGSVRGVPTNPAAEASRRVAGRLPLAVSRAAGMSAGMALAG